MKIPALLYHILFYGALVVAFFALMYRKYVPREPAPAVPAATALGSPVRRTLHRLAPYGHWLVFLIAATSAALLFKCSTTVVIVTDGGARRTVYLGGTPSYPLAPGQSPNPLLDETWVVNQSSHDVKIVHLTYGKGLGFDDGPTIIPPGTAGQCYDVDYLGPDDRPPDRIEVQDPSKLGSAFRNWVTW